MDDSTLISIREFANFTGVNQSTLRYYDEIGLLKAASRGGANNYRYYEPVQRRALNFISVLTDLGVPISDIRKMSEERSPESLINLLTRQEVELDYKLYELRTAYSIIHTFRRNIQSGMLGKADEVRLEYLESANYILGPVNEFNADEEDDNNIYNESYVRFCNAARDYRINLRYPIGGYYYGMDSFLLKPNRPDKYFSLDPIGNCTRDGGQYLVGYKRGHQGDFAELARKIAGYADENGLKPNGPVYSTNLLDEISVNDPDQYLTRIAVSVSRDSDICQRTQNPDNCPFKETCVKPHCLNDE